MKVSSFDFFFFGDLSTHLVIITPISSIENTKSYFLKIKDN